MALRTISEQFREDLLKVNLQTPPDIVLGLTDFGGSSYFAAYRDQLGKDAVLHNMPVNDPGNLQDISTKIREFLFKRNLQTPSDIEEAIIDLSANQSETMRNMGAIGQDATINWRAVVVDPGTIDNAADITRLANLSRNKPRDITDPSESNQDVTGEGYNYTSLLQTIGTIGDINNFTVPNFQSISAKDNPITQEALKLDLRTNKYAPDNFYVGNVREAILNDVYERTTYVTDYTTSLKGVTPDEYVYRNFYNVNNTSTLDNIMTGQSTLINSDTMLMNIAAYMLNFNLQQRFEQNLYNETLGRINLYNENYQSQFNPSFDPLELIKIAKDPMDNLIEKNFTITVPRNFVGKAAQFLLGLEGVVSPFDLWESVDLGGKDLKPTCFLSNEGIDAKRALDPTFDDAAKTGLGEDTTTTTNKKDDDSLIKKTGGGQRWALYTNLNMNKYSPHFETSAEMINIGGTKPPAGNYYLGLPITPPIDLLQNKTGFNIINNNVLSPAFNKTLDGTFDDPNRNIVWTNDTEWDLEFANTNAPTNNTLSLTWDKIAANSLDTAVMGYNTDRPLGYSTSFDFRPSSLLDVTQKLLWAGRVDSPISNVKTRFRDGQYVYSKGAAVKKVQVTQTTDKSRNIYTIPHTKEEVWEDGFCRTWTKVKPFRKIAHLVRYGELIRRERNSVIDRNANYNIFPSKLNVGTIYDQQMLAKDGIRERFADKNFDKVRARKYMFSIENLAWKDSSKFEALPNYQQGANGGRIMWFPPYGLTFNETDTADWTKHSFLGRPEAVYTYNNTERTGVLNFYVIVDHPSILNLLVQKELARMSDNDVDDILAAFFAGCLEYDIFELARIWGVFSNEDIQFFKGVLQGDYEYPALMTSDKQTRYNYKKSTQATPVGDDGKQRELIDKLRDLKFYFPNDEPRAMDASYFDIQQTYDDYLKNGTIQTSSKGCQYNYANFVGQLNVNGIDGVGEFFATDTTTRTNWDREIADIDAAITDLISYVDEDLPADKMIDIQIKAFASTVSPDQNASGFSYNRQLAIRRARSVAKKIIDAFNSSWAKQKYTMTIDDITADSTSFNAYVNDSNGNPRVKITGDMSADNFVGLSASSMLSQANWTVSTPVTSADNVAGYVAESENDYVSDDCNSDPTKNKTIFSVLSYPACRARRVELIANIPYVQSTVVTETINAEPIITTNPVVITAEKSETFNLINKRDIATRILNKLIGENEYFEALNENSPAVFDSLKEKLKYFSPAFHSMTPEGLNARLTFLHQCVRPGETIEYNPKNSSNVVNTAFGKPPVCILRLGDFYNTKMIINNFNIEYANAGGNVTFDLNPEGIGMQPMIAKVSMNVTYLGGQGLREPVAQLQNALSFNYYANADMYETMSYGQTNLDERYLENLELGYDSTALDISLLSLNEYEKIKNEVTTNFDYIGKKTKTYKALTPIDLDYNPEHKISTGLDVVQYYDMDYSEAFNKMYSDYTTYIDKALRLPSIAGLAATSKTPYDFFLLVYAGYLGAPNFGTSKMDASLFPHLKGGVTVNSEAAKRYFTIGYDSYNKSNNIATPRLHLYPQEHDRIVDPNAFGIKTFAGVALPPYFDSNYVNANIEVYATALRKRLMCEEWAPFNVATYGQDYLRGELIKLNPVSIAAFRNAIVTELNAYVSKIKQDWGAAMVDTTGLFLNSYDSILKVTPILNGIDGGGSTQGVGYIEVAPLLTGSTAPTLQSYLNGTIHDLDALKDYPYSISELQTTALTTVNTEADDIDRGNFNYLKDQTTNPTWQPSHYLYYDFTSGEWKRDGSAVPGVTIMSVFERLNYEFLYFSNVTLDVLSRDEFSGVVHEFGTVAKTRDFSTSPTKKEVQNQFGLGNSTVYSYGAMKYTGTTNTNLVNLPIDDTYSVEELVFMSFITSLLDSARRKTITDKMTAGLTAADVAKVNSFMNKFYLATVDATSNTKSGQVANQMDDVLTELRGLMTTTTNEWALAVAPLSTIDATNYTMKMFEVDFSRANANGKYLLNEYLKFADQNPRIG